MRLLLTEIATNNLRVFYISFRTQWMIQGNPFSLKLKLQRDPDPDQDPEVKVKVQHLPRIEVNLEVLAVI